ncbi:hypothetical protein J5S49_13585 [Virgibacillus halodenitrificans]|uniref:hypothetical protein n=1 Tax=Virgibacillus halodenitrificans TaxID=1482 RepID=UPI001F4227DA|nr:hypothetical protein [Virgibacillus halodenitrificans]MCG1029324.1 hypothetical protein [Virgibacillus halodenitrificans]
MDANMDAVVQSLQSDVAELSRAKAIISGQLATANKQIEKYKEIVAGYEEKEMAENLKEDEQEYKKKQNKK